MNLTVLGKYGPYPKKGGATSGYLLEGDNLAVMLDFGSGVASRLTVEVEKLDAIILSHTHFDHTSDLLVLSYRIKNKLRVYMPKNQNGGLAQTIIATDAFDIVEYDENTVFEIKGVRFSFAKMVHPVTSYAVKAADGKSSFVYTGDTVYNDGLVKFCRGANTVLADAMQKEDFKGPHMTVRDAYNIYIECGARVICSHCPPQNQGDISVYDGLIEAMEGETYQV